MCHIILTLKPNIQCMVWSGCLKHKVYEIENLMCACFGREVLDSYDGVENCCLRLTIMFLRLSFDCCQANRQSGADIQEPLHNTQSKKKGAGTKRKTTRASKLQLLFFFCLFVSLLIG